MGLKSKKHKLKIPQNQTIQSLRISQSQNSSNFENFDSNLYSSDRLQNSSQIKSRFQQLHHFQKVTFDWQNMPLHFFSGVQANIEIRPNLEEVLIKRLEQAKQKKKQKRRQYKRRKKLEKQQLQISNNQQFKNIINSFYQDCQNNRFQDQAHRLEQLVCSFNQNHFKNIFDEVLKERVKLIQNSIWDYIQNVLQMNPSEMENDHPFFYETLDLFYQYYELIEKGSQQAEQVIYIYLALNAKDPKQPINPQNLGRKIFRYLIQTDHSLEKLLRMCDKKVSYVRVEQRLKLEKIFSQLKNYRLRQEEPQTAAESEDENNSMSEMSDGKEDKEDESDECEYEENQEYEDEKSTAFSENSEEGEERQNTLMKKMKKKKINLQNLSEEDRLFYELQNFTVTESNRLLCRVNEEQIEQKAKFYINKFHKSKLCVFEEIKYQLDQIPKCREIAKEFKRTF